MPFPRERGWKREKVAVEREKVWQIHIERMDVMLLELIGYQIETTKCCIYIRNIRVLERAGNKTP